MNVGRYLRGEDRHVGTARTTQPQPPQRTEQEPVAHPERHELQAKGEHPAPCARHCEANAFKIVIKNLKAQLAQRKPLTHEQRLDLITEFEKHRMKWDDIGILIDLVEAAHGIKENT